MSAPERTQGCTGGGDGGDTFLKMRHGVESPKVKRRPYARCANCNGHREQVGELSRTRLCASCAEALLAQNIIGMKEKSGPAWNHWRRSMIEYADGLRGERASVKV